MGKFFKLLVAILCTVSLICVSSFATIRTVNADSGWDSDYDSGGSDWDSDWDSDWGSDWDDDDYGYVGSSDGDIAGVVFAIIFIIVVAIIILTTKQKNRNIQSRSIASYNTGMSIDNILKVDPNLNVEEFKKTAFNIYKEIQDAWMNFDYEKLRKYTTDEIYNMYTMQLDTLKVKGQKNVMRDFILVDSYVSNVYIQNNIETIDFVLTTNFYDYVVDTNNKIVRGSDKFKLEITYHLTFIRTLSAGGDNNYCPSCGAKIEDKASVQCPYCNSVIVSSNYDWVMSKKKSVLQRRK